MSWKAHLTESEIREVEAAAPGSLVAKLVALLEMYAPGDKERYLNRKRMPEERSAYARRLEE